MSEIGARKTLHASLAPISHVLSPSRPDYLPLGLLGRFVTIENETKLNLIDVKIVFLPLTEFCCVPRQAGGAFEDW